MPIIPKLKDFKIIFFSSQKTQETGPNQAWTGHKTGYWRSVKTLLRKIWLTKIRHFAAIIEILGAFFIFNLIWPVHHWGRFKYPGELMPNITNVTIPNPELLMFLGSLLDPSIVIMPDNNNTHTLVDPILDLIEKNISIKKLWVNDTQTMFDFIYSINSNGVGILWNNSFDEDCWVNPDIIVYHQSFGPTPSRGLAAFFRAAIANHNKNFSLMTMKLQEQQYATPRRITIFDARFLVGYFALMPIMFATMDDLQIILDEKDNKIASLLFLMGCPESAYWIVLFITSFIQSIGPHIFMGVMWCYVYMLVGTSFSVFMVTSLLFISAHIFFQMFCATFMKHSKNGRAFMVTTCVFIYFTALLHMNLTLNENLSSKLLKNILQIVPFSSYLLLIMTMYTQCRESLPPITWSTMNANELFDCWWAVMWLIADNIIYLLLFLIFNAILPRAYGTPPIPFSQIFSLKAWKRLFSKRSTIVQAELQNANAKEAIKVEDLSKIYKGFVKVNALKHVNFTINTGEVIVIIGPNGAGKSTLMNTLSGFIKPTSGTLRLFGGEATDNFRDIQDVLGICFQENVLLEKLTVREHFEMFGAFRGISEQEVEDAINFFGSTLQLDHSLNTRSGDLSGGQKRKLCIAITLLGAPPIVIMDEPTAGVDIQARQLIWKTISSLTNTTTIVTSHALEEAEAVSSRLFIVAGGEIAFMGTSTEMRKQYKCGYLLKVDSEDKSAVKRVLEIAKHYVDDAKLFDERSDTISMSVSSAIPEMLKELRNKKSSLNVRSFAFSVEQLEDVLMRLIQSGEAALNTNQQV